jgi:phosphohistidine phosphatase
MTLRLILMRHAKSDWVDPLLPDHARPLNPRGRASATAMGQWMRQHTYIPQQALVSDAQRTKDTFTGLETGLTPELRPDLYHASSDRMLRVLQDGTKPCLLMVGHNPGIADFAARLVRNSPAHRRFHDYPTCATLVADFDAADWGNVRFGTGTPVDFAIPREVLEG